MFILPDEYIEKYKNREMTAAEIAKAIGKPIHVVYANLKNIKKNPFVLSEEFVEKYKKKEMTIAEIAKVVKKCQSVIRGELISKNVYVVREKNDRNLLIVDKFLKGETERAIAKEMGITYQRVSQIISKHKPKNAVRVVVNNRTKFSIPQELIEKFTIRQISVKEIAVLLNANYNTVRKYLYENRILSSQKWTEEKVLDKIKEIGYFPSATELHKNKEFKLYGAIQRLGGFPYFRNLFEQRK